MKKFSKNAYSFSLRADYWQAHIGLSGANKYKN